jgi:tetratricopeptide (TPR) repeat protein
MLIAAALLSAQSRGASLEAAVGPGVTVGKQWAVFIAVDRYREWGPLGNPVRDAREIRDILREHYYIDEVRELYDGNATGANIRRLFAELRAQTGRDDSVFVFYAGHGYTDEITKSGSWIPTDGGTDLLAQTNWLPNIHVRNMLDALPAKHVFLVSDACFSGDILNAQRGVPRINSDYYRRAYAKVSRQVMTSGASESVPDTSEFALRLKSSLRRAEGVCIDPQYLFTQAREVRQTQPMLGTIAGGEHQEGGSFLFFRRQAAAAAVTLPAVTPTVVTPPVLPPAPVVNGKEHYDKGRLFYEREDYDTALLEFTEAIRLNPHYAEAHYERGRVYHKQEDDDKAAASYTEAIRLNPRYAEAYNERGNAYRKKKDYDKAIADCTQAIRLNPQFAEAYNDRGAAYHSKKDNDRAIAGYNEAIRLNPQYAEAYANRGVFYNEQKDYDKAMADFNEAIRLDPQSAYAYYSRGNAYYKQKDYDRAAADFNEAIRLNPKSVGAYNNRGFAYYEQKDYGKAI